MGLARGRRKPSCAIQAAPSAMMLPPLDRWETRPKDRSAKLF